jgi:hypothetical protein
MAAQPGENEGFHLLDEFVCQAIPDPSLGVLEATAAGMGRGENAGMQVREEITLDCAGPSDPQGTSTRAGAGIIEIVIDRDFASYSTEEQDRLMSAIRHLLVVAGDVRVVKRVSG